MIKFFRKSLLLILCTLISIVCIFCISDVSKGNVQVLTYGKFVIPVVSMQGIIAAINSLCCILMVFIDFKKGSKISFTVMGVSTILALIPILTAHTFAPLPGIVTNLVSLISIIVIYSFYRKSTINKII